MKDLFLFFRREDGSDAQLEREFRSIYQEPSLRYLQLAFVLAITAFAGFLAMDLISGKVIALPAASALRAAIVLVFVLGLLATIFKRRLVNRHYTPIVNFFMALAMLAAALLPVVVHGYSSRIDIYWSLSSSLTTAAIVIYGFSRLTARNDAVIVVSGCIIGLASALGLPSFEWHDFGRLAFHLVFVNIAAFSLRETVERRERQLFLMARENLSKNIYAEALESAKKRAEEGNEVKLRFLANMSHEFRTPMHAVLQTLEIARRTADRELLDLIDRAVGSGQALLATLNSVLEYTRWTQAGLSAKRTRVSLTETLREAVSRHEKAASDRGLALVLRLDLASSEDVVLIDELMLGEVISRLLDNAIRFTRQGRVNAGVELRPRENVSYPSALLVLTVADTGVGIPEDRHQAIYAPFYQVDDGSNRQVGGTGLGLAIVRRLVDVMKGAISLDSQPGAGSTFRVTLPVEVCRVQGAWKDSPIAALRARPATSNLGFSGTVLLVEDNELNAALAAELLTLMGLRVTLAFDGEQAHRAAQDDRFDLILMDCQMPGVDGYEATRRIRQTERVTSSAAVPIVAITANALAGDREKCLATGMNDYLAKPYTAAQLRTKLAAWLPPGDEDASTRAAKPTSATSRPIRS